MTFAHFTDAALLKQLIDANHSAIRSYLMLCAIEDAMDHADGLAVAPPSTLPATCAACQQPWHITTPTGFTNGPKLADMSLSDLRIQYSNYRHSGADEYAARVEDECQKRGLLT